MWYRQKSAMAFRCRSIRASDKDTLHGKSWGAVRMSFIPEAAAPSESVTSLEQAVVRGLVAGSGTGRTGAVAAGACLMLEGVERSRFEALVFHGNNFMGYFEEERFHGRIAYLGT
jgi:hypothetical protein